MESDKSLVSLSDLPVGKLAKVQCIVSNGNQRRRFLDLGLIPGSIIKSERKSPSGNPTAYNIRGSIIALRNEEAQNIVVSIV
ncbi:ferrous iron transport protein A [Gottschalkia purinilytica]|uniref:Ferrous iron transport protein A n=1 Tax=Gottschalkia purinilytica TaxID=1503 RepID=A0A0L0W9H2_GOTPU|nr:FeoA family protein [Gottschalkia purinilytica]KNF08087.1 ferrous iron transport protein A [Gottschalkia purinilytica]